MRRRNFLAGLALGSRSWAQAPAALYDLLLKDAPVVGRAGRVDIALVGDKIAGVAPGLPAAHARLVVEAGEYYVTPGLIDIHTHFHPSGDGPNLQPDHHALPNGVTTAVTLAPQPGRARTRLLSWGSAGMPKLGDGSADGLAAGDIFSGIYGEKPVAGEELRKRGVLLDTGTFWFRVAGPAIRKGFLPDTISTDIQKDNILLVRANMMNTLSKFLNLGMTLEQVIERVTVNAARAIRRPELGQLREGAPADLAVLRLETGKFGFVDAGHTRLTGDRRLRCVLTVRAGRVVWDSEGLSMTEWTHAGPYSNYK
jgi:predicted amidohydrolase